MRKWLWIIGLVVALLAIVAWRVGIRVETAKNLNAAAQTRKAASSNVEVATATSGDIVQHLQTVGSITTPFDIKLGSKIAGVVNYLSVRPGDDVKAGQVLVRIDPVEQEAAVAQMRSALAEAQQRYSQALITQNPTNTQVHTQIGQMEASVAGALANEGQVTANYAAQVQTAQAQVTDAAAKVASATSQQGAANQTVVSAQANQKDAAAKYSREYTLYKQGYVSAQDADDAEAAKNVQDAAVASAKQSLDASKSAVQSAQAELVSAQQNLSIVKKQGTANIVVAKAATNTARQNLKYARSNTAQIPAYVQNLKALKSEVDAAQAQLTNAIAVVGDTMLKTPFDGTVTSRMIDPGSMATAGEELLEVQFLDWLYVTCTAPVDYASSIQVGQTASLTFDALPGQTFSAPVVLVTHAADPTVRQFTFEIRLDNHSRMFKPGMFGHVDLVTGKTPVGILVPREAVTNGDTGTTVTVLQDITTDSSGISHATAKVIHVTVGGSDPKNIEIKSGVNAGDKVIIVTYRAVKDGTKVTFGSQKETGSPNGHSSPGSKSR